MRHRWSVAPAERLERWDWPQAEVIAEHLYVAADGVMVHETDGYHQAKTVTCCWKQPDGQREARYAVRFETAAAFAALVWSLACRCGLNSAKELILLGDGAKWNRDHSAPPVEGVTCIVDGYHAMEHVWDCGRRLHGEGTPATTAWVKGLEALLWDRWRGRILTAIRRVREMLRRVRAEAVQARSPTRRKALPESITYVGNQDDRFAYDQFRARGLNMGSGCVQTACKHVVGLRMKRRGMHESRRGSQATLSPPVAWLNGQWKELWGQAPPHRMTTDPQS